MFRRDQEVEEERIEVLQRVFKLGYVQLPRRILAVKPTFKNVVLVSAEVVKQLPHPPPFELHAVEFSMSGLSLPAFKVVYK